MFLKGTRELHLHECIQITYCYDENQRKLVTYFHCCFRDPQSRPSSWLAIRIRDPNHLIVLQLDRCIDPHSATKERPATLSSKLLLDGCSCTRQPLGLGCFALSMERRQLRPVLSNPARFVAVLPIWFPFLVPIPWSCKVWGILHELE